MGALCCRPVIVGTSLVHLLRMQARLPRVLPEWPTCAQGISLLCLGLLVAPLFAATSEQLALSGGRGFPMRSSVHVLSSCSAFVNCSASAAETKRGSFHPRPWLYIQNVLGGAASSFSTRHRAIATLPLGAWEMSWSPTFVPPLSVWTHLRSWHSSESLYIEDLGL